MTTCASDAVGLLRPNEAVSESTYRKISRRILPLLFLCYIINYIDRVNIGIAQIQFKADLHFSDLVYGIGAGLFFVGFLLFEVPSNLLLAKMGARKTLLRIMVLWGAVSNATMFVSTPAEFYIARMLLGVAEAGFFPGIILYLSYWFPARNRAGVTSFFMAAAPISTALGSPISAGLLEMNGILGLAGWQWLFIMEAIPALVLGVVVFFYMTDRPEQASWLEKDERDWLVGVMNDERAANKTASANHSFIRGLADPRVLALALIYFGTSAGLYTLGIWAPQIIKQMGVSSMTVGLLNAIPPTVSVIAMVLWSRHSDRTGERTWHVIIACLAAATGLVVAATSGSLLGLIAALTLVNVGISCAKPPLWTMPTMFLSGAAAATGIATINSIGNLGGFAGPAMIGWIKDQTGSFSGGLYFVAGLLVLSAVVTLVLANSRKASVAAAS